MSQIVAEALPQVPLDQVRSDALATGSGPTSDVEAFLDDARFNRTFTLPPRPGRSAPFHVTYSDYGYRNPDQPEQENVLLFCGPLLSSRFLHVAKDKLAKKYKVRIINPDRPGIGGTTEVEKHLRLDTWIEIVPALLQHLNVSHVTLACQSAGTLYALHTLLHLRHLLRPDRPYVTFCGPWVHPTHSGLTLLSLSNLLPPAILQQFDTVAGFVQSSVAPVIGFSGRLFSSLIPSWAHTKQPLAEGADVEMVELEETMLQRFIARTYAESVHGLGQEVLLVLKKVAWGTWDDVDKIVPMLAALEEKRAAENPSSAQLEVEMFFAESDNMIGETAGPQWLADCWKPERRGEGIRFQSHTIKGTEHETILNLRFGIAERIFRKISGMGEESD
ncbi:hypothetical protein SCUP234_05037 [Seiridium cupressi]